MCDPNKNNIFVNCIRVHVSVLLHYCIPSIESGTEMHPRLDRRRNIVWCYRDRGKTLTHILQDTTHVESSFSTMYYHHLTLNPSWTAIVLYKHVNPQLDVVSTSTIGTHTYYQSNHIYFLSSSLSSSTSIYRDQRHVSTASECAILTHPTNP